MKILIMTLSNLGDAILTTGVLEAVKKKFPDSKIDVFLGPRAKDVFISDPGINEVIVYDKKISLSEKISLFKKLRANNYQFVIDLRNSFISYFLGQQVLKSKNIKAHRYLYHNSSLSKFYSYQELKDFKPKIYWYDNDEKYINSFGFKSYIVISPLARSSTKAWPLENFQKLISLLRENVSEMEIILVGEENEFKACEKLICDEKVKNFAGKTTIKQLAYLISKAKLVITNDSAVLHVASCVNSPTISFFGPTSEMKYRALSPISLVLRRHYPCSPCQRAQCFYQGEIVIGQSGQCLAKIRPEEVFDYITRILREEKIQIRSDYKRILLIRTDKIGDLILSTPAIEVMRKNFPNSYIAFLCNYWTKEILKNNPYLDEVITLDKKGKHKGLFGFLKILTQIKRRNFDLAINFHPTKRVHLLCFLAGIKNRIGYDWKLGWLNNIVIKHLKQFGEKSEAEYNFDLLKKISMNEISFRQTLIPEPEALKWLEQEIKIKGISEFIVIHPGASCKSKLWPLDNFINLTKKIIENYDFKIIFILGPKENYLGQIIRKELNDKVIVYSNLNLSNLVALVSRAKFMISNDSGPMHIADAFLKPLIVIFGRNQPGLSFKRWGPLNESAIILHKDIGCKICLAHNCQRDFLCLKEITPEEVYHEFEHLVEGGRE